MAPEVAPKDSVFRLTRVIGFEDIESLGRTGSETFEPEPRITEPVNNGSTILALHQKSSDKIHAVGCGRRVRQNNMTNSAPPYADDSSLSTRSETAGT